MTKINPHDDVCYDGIISHPPNCIMTSIIEKNTLRKKILDVCIAKQQFLIDDFKERIRALTEADGLGNEEPYDNSIVSSNSTKAIEINTLNNLLDFANQELELLENLKTTQQLVHDRASLGAIVVTNHHTFFISASLEKFTVDGHTYVGISTSSPIYQAMSGKSKGDSFVFRGVEYKIKDLF